MIVLSEELIKEVGIKVRELFSAKATEVRLSGQFSNFKVKMIDKGSNGESDLVMTFDKLGIAETEVPEIFKDKIANVSAEALV